MVHPLRRVVIDLVAFRNRREVAFSITLGVWLAACSSGSSTSSAPAGPSTPSNPSDPPSRAQYDDTARVIALATAIPGGGGSTAAMRDVISLARGRTPLGLSGAGGRAQGTRLGVDYDYTLTCKNAAGGAGACGSLTEQAAAEASWSAQVSIPGFDASVSAMASWSAAGLGSDTATLSGDSAFSASLTLPALAYSFETSASYKDVQLSTQPPQILGGSATADVTARAMTGTADASFEASAQIMFPGDGTADIVLDGTQHYTLDLTTGSVVREDP